MGKLRQISTCKVCKETKGRSQMATRKSNGRLRGMCRDCLKKHSVEVRIARDQLYRIFKKEYCEMCGFRGNACQLDVNHKDMNHDNNDLKNLETLCANCHRFVTFVVQRGVKPT